MTDPNEPAYPVKVYDGSLQEAIAPRGLTKREYFAAMAMQGMISGSQGLEIAVDEFAERSAMLADALIAELNKA